MATAPCALNVASVDDRSTGTSATATTTAATAAATRIPLPTREGATIPRSGLRLLIVYS